MVRMDNILVGMVANYFMGMKLGMEFHISPDLQYSVKSLLIVLARIFYLRRGCRLCVSSFPSQTK